MRKETTHVALDESKRKVVVAILGPGATEPEQRETPKDPHHIQRLLSAPRARQAGPSILSRRVHDRVRSPGPRPISATPRPSRARFVDSPLPPCFNA